MKSEQSKICFVLCSFLFNFSFFSLPFSLVNSLAPCHSAQPSAPTLPGGRLSHCTYCVGLVLPLLYTMAKVPVVLH